MKKITLIISICFLSYTGYAQQQPEDVQSIQKEERKTEYIIVLDGTKVEGNIGKLLTGNVLHDDKQAGHGLHELVHNAPNEFNLEGKLVEGSFSYNEYAIHYKPKSRIGIASS
jgi:hypothetical protein